MRLGNAAFFCRQEDKPTFPPSFQLCGKTEHNLTQFTPAPLPLSAVLPKGIPALQTKILRLSGKTYRCDWHRGCLILSVQDRFLVQLFIIAVLIPLHSADLWGNGVKHGNLLRSFSGDIITLAVLSAIHWADLYGDGVEGSHFFIR